MMYNNVFVVCHYFWIIVCRLVVGVVVWWNRTFQLHSWWYCGSLSKKYIIYPTSLTSLEKRKEKKKKKKQTKTPLREMKGEHHAKIVHWEECVDWERRGEREKSEYTCYLCDCCEIRNKHVLRLLEVCLRVCMCWVCIINLCVCVCMCWMCVVWERERGRGGREKWKRANLTRKSDNS